MAQVGRKEKVCVQSPRYQNTVCPNRIRERWKQIINLVINNITSSYSGQSNKEYAYASKLKGLGWLATSCLGSEHIRKSNAVALKTLCTSPLVFVPRLFAASPIFLTETKYTVKSVLELMAYVTFRVTVLLTSWLFTWVVDLLQLKSYMYFFSIVDRFEFFHVEEKLSIFLRLSSVF